MQFQHLVKRLNWVRGFAIQIHSLLSNRVKWCFRFHQLCFQSSGSSFFDPISTQQLIYLVSRVSLIPLMVAVTLAGISFHFVILHLHLTNLPDLQMTTVINFNMVIPWITFDIMTMFDLLLDRYFCHRYIWIVVFYYLHQHPYSGSRFLKTIPRLPKCTLGLNKVVVDYD